MKREPGSLLAILIMLVALAANADHPRAIPITTDWSSDAALARTGQIPLMVIFGTEECNYCERLNHEVLEPMLARGEFEGKALVREFDINGGGKVTDFDGEPVRTRVFVERYDVFATPTVMMVDYQGEPLTQPIVGYNDADTYRESLDDALASAMFALAAASQPRYAKVDSGQDQ